jgi:hypothetical protein
MSETETRRDWLSLNNETLYDNAARMWAYLHSGDAHTRLGFGMDPGGGINPFERGVTGVAASTGSPNGDWLENEFFQLLNNFAAAYKAWADPALRTKVDIENLKQAKAAFTAVYRKLYQLIKHLPTVTNGDLAAMGFPTVSAPTHTPVPPPNTAPEAEIRFPAPSVVEIHFRDAGSERKGKSHGVHGAEIGWAILESAPSKMADLVHSSFDTNSPFRLTFDIDQRGKTLYFAVRWENTRGEKGPWSEIHNVIVT